MTVIQDLPLELLRRILELLATDRRPQKDLYKASLVARAWRHPSHSLLIYHMDVQDSTLCTDVLRLNAGCTLRLVDVDWRDAREILSALHENDISVENLNVYRTVDGDLDMSTMSLKLLAGAFCVLTRRRSSLTTTQALNRSSSVDALKGAPQSRRTPSSSSLISTSTATTCPPWPSLDSILPAAPLLTSLELYVGDDGELLPPVYIPPFRAVAHQHRHLTISIGLPFSPPISRASLDVTRLVASCISLESLAVDNCGTAYLRDVAATARAHLCVREMQVTSGRNEGENQIAELISVLELPAMAELKRWKMCKRRLYGGLLGK
jgi:hypothetical protein